VTGRRSASRPTWFGDWRATEEGSVTAFVVVLTVAILAVAGLALDGGLALAAKVRATGEAEAAARAGAQALDLAAYRTNSTVRLMPAQAVDSARHYLSIVDAEGDVAITGSTVTVAITSTQPTTLLGLVGISSLQIHSQASAHPQRGVVDVEP
jgi:Flp pilus assembly protein TadG